MDRVLAEISEKMYVHPLVQSENWSLVNSQETEMIKCEYFNIAQISDYVLFKIPQSGIKTHFKNENRNKGGSTKKNTKKSEAVRKKADELFKNKQWFEALQLYTKSIAFAKNNSVNLALAYASRSTLLMYRGFYRECLEDIDRALQLDYPEDKIAQLHMQQEKVKKLLPTQSKRIFDELLPDLRTKNPNLRGASDAIKLSENEKFGRYIEATRDIQIGEILLIEDPYALIVAQNRKTTHCGDCGQLCFNLIPCEQCCVEMYCTEECRERAFREYHQYECVVMSYYPKEIFEVNSVSNNPDDKRQAKMRLEQIRQLSLRITLKGFNSYQISEDDNSTKTNKLYEEVDKIQSHKDDVKKSAKFILAFNCVKQFLLLKNYTNFFSKIRFYGKEDILKYHLLRNRLICCFNVGTIQYKLDEPVSDLVTQAYIGFGLYPVYSMFNHSCTDNVGYGYYGKTIVMRAKQTIKKGEQCFINYGQSFFAVPKNERQNLIKENYLFTCQCDACKNSWPVFTDPNKVRFNSKVNTYSTLLHFDILQRMWNREKCPTEQTRQEIFKVCQELEKKVSRKRPNMNWGMMHSLLSCVCFNKYQGYNF